MRPSKRKNRFYTILFVPEDNRRTFSIRMHRTVFYLLLCGLLLFGVGTAGLILRAGQIAAKLQVTAHLNHENKRLRQDNSSLLLALHKMEHIEELSIYLQRIVAAHGKKSAALVDDLVLTDGSIDSGEDSALAAPYSDDTVGSLALTNLPATGVIASGMDRNAIPSIRPVDGWITQAFNASQNDSTAHSGVDFAASLGSMILAPAPGVVDSIFTDRYLGIVVVINHGQGYVTRYGHCSQTLVSVKSLVDRGQAIALVGNTGNSSAPHLHYEVRKNGRSINPLDYFYNAQRP